MLSLDAPAGPVPATWADEVGPSVLLLVPGWRDGLTSAGRRELRRAVEAVAATGRRPVVWSERPVGPGDRRELEGAGALVLEADRHAGPGGQPRSCTTRPAPTQLVASLQPDAVVFAAASLVESQFPFLAPALGRRPVLAWLAGADPLPAALAARVDTVVRGAGLAGALGEALARPVPPPARPELGAVPPVASVSGLVSVVIPVWNRWDLTAACLESLRRGGGGPLELVVVDNGSTDATPVALAAAPDVVVVRNEENLGFPRAVNQGLRAARGELVCVLNNDTEVVPGWLDELRAALAVPGTGLVGPRTNRISGWQAVPGSPALADADGDDARRWGAEWAAQRAGRTWTVNRLVGFCFLARRELFERLGGLDERFGLGNFEDDELCQRVLADGRQLRVADGSVVLHHGSATFAALGVDYAKVIFDAARRAPDGRVRAGGLDGLVRADDDPGAVLRSTASLLAVADRVRVLARHEAARCDLAVAGLRALGHDVEVVAVDWQDAAGAEAMFAGLRGDAVVVLGAGEEVRVGEVGAARAALQAAAPGPADLVVDGARQTRLAPPGPAALEVVGASGAPVVPGVAVAAG